MLQLYIYIYYSKVLLFLLLLLSPQLCINLQDYEQVAQMQFFFVKYKNIFFHAVILLIFYIVFAIFIITTNENELF